MSDQDNDFSGTAQTVLQNLSSRTDAPALKEIIEPEILTRDILEIVLRYLSEKGFVRIIGITRNYSDPNVRIQITAEGLEFFRSADKDKAKINQNIFEMIRIIPKGNADVESMIQNIESVMTNQMPNSNEFLLLKERVNQLNQQLQRKITKWNNIRSWFALSLSIIAIIVSILLKIYSPN